MAPLFHHVGRIFGCRSEKEMGRSHAAPIVAGMADKKSLVVRTIEVSVRKSVRKKLSVFTSTSTQKAISLVMHDPTPFPASVAYLEGLVKMAGVATILCAKAFTHKPAIANDAGFFSRIGSSWVRHALVCLTLSLLFSSELFAQSQSIRQSGSVTAKHASCWVANGVLGDCGSASIPFLSSIGTVGQGSTICANSAANTGPYNQICFGANTSSNAAITVQNYGGAPAVSLDFIINGVKQTFTGSTGGVAGDIACFLSASTVTDCGLAATAGTILSGAWHATPVDIPYGGTNASTAAQARTNLGLLSMAQQAASAVAITGGTITGMPSPLAASDVAIKSYVDATSTGLNILAPSTLATAAVLPNTPTYANGASGVGATLTAGSNTSLTVDGTAAPLNTIVLVKSQAAPAQNGIYKVTTAGDGSNPWVLTRATYFDQASEMKAGSYTFITAGATLAGSAWTLQTAVVTVGTDPLNFVLFSSVSVGVTAFNSRTGSVVPASNDYSAAQIGANGVFYKINIQKFTSSGTYTPSTGILYAVISCWGAGGGGGGAQGAGGASSAGGGGGAGSKSIKVSSSAQIGVSQTVTIGVGGTAGFGAGNGSAGGDTSVGVLCIGKGGSGGAAENVNTTIPIGGAGGVAGTGDVTGVGQPGGSGFFGATTQGGPSGFGGSTELGGGGTGVVSGGGSFVGGISGSGPGAGGSGAAVNDSGAAPTAGNGSSGFVSIVEYLNQ